ncbi:hypothetical protein ACFVWY_01360 [Streptomyces sp. NPDC058195]|uniref:hypothetical protein n=1 Tax=Streptomyces sp. NPDC058195 TaxID=3346375 RepID=UPI0036E7FD2D
MTGTVDLVVIGSGQAGLAVGYRQPHELAEDFPHDRELSAGRLRQALEASGLDAADAVTRVVSDRSEAERGGFTGSPATLVNGEDPFVEEGRRLCRTPEGLDGAPGISQSRQAPSAASHRA